MASMIRGYFKESKSCIIYLLLSKDHHVDRHVDDILGKIRNFVMITKQKRILIISHIRLLFIVVHYFGNLDAPVNSCTL